MHVCMSEGDAQVLSYRCLSLVCMRRGDAAVHEKPCLYTCTHILMHALTSVRWLALVRQERASSKVFFAAGFR
jgi:hypothetical protein